MNELEFARAAYWPLCLLLPFVFLGLLFALRGRMRAARRYGAFSTDRVPSPFARSLRLTVAAALGLVCFLDPRLGEETLPIERRGLDLVFCLDTSRSMLASDVEPDRLRRAKTDVKSVLARLAGGDRAGLVVFAGEARLWIPLTHDLDSFGQLLDEIDTSVVPVGGTDLAAAMKRAGELVDQDTAATTVVVLLTDGEDLGGKGREAATELHARGIRVHAVGYGSPHGSKITVQDRGKETFLKSRSGDEVVTRLDTDGLRALAEATGGEFVRADAMPLPLRELYDKRIQPQQKRAFESGEETVKLPRYQWVLLPLLLLLAHDLWTHGGRRR